MLIYVLGTTLGVLGVAFLALLPLFLLFFLGECFLTRFPFVRGTRLLLLLKNLQRSPLRTSLTYLATFVLVVVAVVVWSLLYDLDVVTAEKSHDLKVSVAEKWQPHSQMPFAYAMALSEGAASPSRYEDVRPQDSMTWQYFAGTLDAGKRTRENRVFFIATEPRKLLTMLDGLYDGLSPDQASRRKEPRLAQVGLFQEAVQKMENCKHGVILGRERLTTLNKRVGERFTVTGLTYPGIDLEFQIVGLFPDGRYNQSAVMHRDYLNDALNAYPKTHGGCKHPLADKSLNMVWLRVPDPEIFNRVSDQIESSGLFQDPTVKCETLSAGVAWFLDGYRDLIWGLRWLLSPALVAALTLILANAIGLSVRERRAELAVLKVLGYRPGQILGLVLGEAALLGVVGGWASAGFSYLVVNQGLGSINPLLILIPSQALWWGPALGALAALAGSLLPAWSASRVCVAEVFARSD
jgi:putative ABC transport system permease protein